jgi:hypothetical protein
VVVAQVGSLKVGLQQLEFTFRSVDITQATPDTEGYYALLVSGGFSAGLHNFKVLYSGDAVYNALTGSTLTANFA